MFEDPGMGRGVVYPTNHIGIFTNGIVFKQACLGHIRTKASRQGEISANRIGDRGRNTNKKR